MLRRQPAARVAVGRERGAAIEAQRTGPTARAAIEAAIEARRRAAIEAQRTGPTARAAIEGAIEGGRPSPGGRNRRRLVKGVPL